jgi:ABC-type phosphate/phosphonate transport system permease subunit
LQADQPPGPPVIYERRYRWDINIRESSALGLVGAGGIGTCSTPINLAWQRSPLLIAVFGVVILSEFISAAVRQRIT